MKSTDDTLQKLLDTVGDLYRRLGIRSVSMDDVAREMGISKKTLYQLVENKEALIEMVMKDDACQDLAVLDRHRDESADAIDEFLRNSRYFIHEMRNINPTMLRDLQKYYNHIWLEQIKEHRDAFRRSVSDNIERGMEEGLYRPDLDAGVIAYFFVASMMMIIDTSIFPATKRPLTDIIHQHSAYHFHGIVNDFGRERLEQYLKTENQP